MAKNHFSRSYSENKNSSEICGQIVTFWEHAHFQILNLIKMVAALRNWHKSLTSTDQRSAGRRPLLYTVSSLARVAAGSRAAVTYCLFQFSSSDICTQCVLHPRTIHKTTPLLLPPLPPYSKIRHQSLFYFMRLFLVFSLNAFSCSNCLNNKKVIKKFISWTRNLRSALSRNSNFSTYPSLPLLWVLNSSLQNTLTR